MLLRRRTVFVPFAGLWAAAWLASGGGGCGGTYPPNTLIDRDGDGLPDYVRVGDFDHDGVLEIDDIQDAANALTDPGPKRIDLVAGTFLPPANPAARAGRTFALLELRSFTTLDCGGTTSVILRGPPPTAGQDYAVISNIDHTLGNDEVWIRNCQIDGGAPPSYASTAFPHNQRMGVYFRRTRHSGVSDSYVHGTVHAGLYTSNSTGDQFLRNRVDDVGGYGDTTGLWHQPCIYLFAFGGGTVLSDFQAVGNTLTKCGHSGLNTRAEDTDAPGDVIRNMLWEHNTVDGTRNVCINLRGVDGATVRDLTCAHAGAIETVRGFGSGYRFQGNDNANSNVLIEDATATDVDAGQVGLDIGAWNDGLTLRRVRVERTRDASGAPLYKDCAWLQRPQRGAVLEDVTLDDCGRAALVVSQLTGGLGDASETLTLRRLAASGLDQLDPLDTNRPPGLEFDGDQSRLLLEDVTISGASGPELSFGGALTNSTLRRIEIDSVDPGWLGPFIESTAPACTPALKGRWLTSQNGSSAVDCSFGAGTGGAHVRCGCSGSAWSAITSVASSGIDFAAGVTHADDLLEDITVKNARGVTGVRVRGLLSNFSIQTILGADDSLATDLDQRSAADFDATSGFTVTGASCSGTQAGVPCIE